MKWKEPWITSIREQEKYNIFSKSVLLSCIVWVSIFLFIGVLVSFIQSEFHPDRLFYASIIGVPLALFLYTVRWVSPVQITSGPNGIVLDKGGNLSLIPWENIDGYEIKVSDKFNKLILSIGNIADKRGLFIPKSVDIELIKKEIDENT